jgi:hypothetical protein
LLLEKRTGIQDVGGPILTFLPAGALCPKIFIHSIPLLISVEVALSKIAALAADN